MSRAKTWLKELSFMTHIHSYASIVLGIVHWYVFDTHNLKWSDGIRKSRVRFETLRLTGDGGGDR